MRDSPAPVLLHRNCILIPRSIPHRNRILLLRRVKNKLCALKSGRCDAHTDPAACVVRGYDCKELSREQSFRRSLYALIVRAVAIVEADKVPRAAHFNRHPAAGVFHRGAVLIHSRNCDKEQLCSCCLTACCPAALVRLQDNPCRILKGTDALGRDAVSIAVVPLGEKLSRLKGRPVVRNQMLSAPRLVREPLSSEALSVQEKLRLHCVGGDPDIDHLPGVMVPVRENMDHGVFGRIPPGRLPDIIRVLRKTRGVDQAEEGIPRMVGRRLAEIVGAAPDKLSQGPGNIPVDGNAVLQTLRAPAGRRIAERRALAVILAQLLFRKREMIDSAALYDRGGLTPENRPVRVLFMVRRIIFFAVVIANEF